MLRRTLSVFLSLLIVCSLAGCGRSEALLTGGAPEENRKLVIYTSHKAEIYQPIVREFEERTGIWVEVVTGGTNELLGRIDSEQNSPKADIMFGGGGENLEAYSGCFAAYRSAETEAIDPGLYDGESLWFPFSRLPLVLIYNTKLVEADAFTGWSDLIGGTYDGRIAFADPSLSGSCFTAVATEAYATGGDFDGAVKEFALALQGNLYNSSGAIIPAVADGTMAVGVTLEETILNYSGSADDVGIVYPAEGTSCVPDGIAIIRDARNAENAELFVDFVLGSDVQQHLELNMHRRSVRTDTVSGSAVPPLSELDVIDYDIRWVTENRERLLSEWSFWFGQEGEE